MNFTSPRQGRAAEINHKRKSDSPMIEVAEKTMLELFGAEQAARAKPLFLKNRTLTITCSSQEMGQAIHARQQEIVDKINEKLGKKEVDRIRYLS